MTTWGFTQEEVDKENGTTQFPWFAAQHHLYKLAKYNIEVDENAKHPMQGLENDIDA